MKKSLSNKGNRRRLPTRGRGQVSFNGTTIAYDVRRSPRRKKTVEIRLSPQGVLVAAPSRASDDQIRDIVLKRAPLIVKRMAELPEEPLPRRFVTGESLPYLGRSVEMIVEDGQTSSTQVSLHQGKFQVSVRPTLEKDVRRESIRQAFAAWYGARAEEHIAEGVDLWWPSLGVGERSRVLIGNQRSRWGSCAPDGTLRFSWRTMMLPPEVVEYIVVHELAHLTVKAHSTEFWGFVSRALPDVKDRRKLLREVGPALPL